MKAQYLICKCGNEVQYHDYLDTESMPCSHCKRIGCWSFGYEWRCPECYRIGDYLDLRNPLDLGVDKCPDCHCEVDCVE